MSDDKLVKVTLPVKKRQEVDRDARWLELICRVRKHLLDPNKSPAKTRELLELRAKLLIMGPEFLDAGEARIRAMFDKRVQ